MTAMTAGKVRHLDRRQSGEERARDGGAQWLRLDLGTARCRSGMQSSVVTEEMERRWWHGGDDPWCAQTGLCWKEGNGGAGLEARSVDREREWGLAGCGMLRGGGRARAQSRHAEEEDVGGGPGGSPKTVVPGHARGRQGKRAGAPMSGPARRVGPSCRERGREDGREGDSGARDGK
jgi:hypothetical protein